MDNMKRASKRKRELVPTACAECKRRKVKCDGVKPCSSCKWYKCEDRCLFTGPKQRSIISKKEYQQVEEKADRYLDIIQTLFPGLHPDMLTEHPPKEVIKMLRKLDNEDPTPGSSGETTQSPASQSSKTNLDKLAAVTTHYKWKEEGSLIGQSSEDDVNALSIMNRERSSYLGASSVGTAVKVILEISPIPIVQLPPPQQKQTEKPSTHTNDLVDVSREKGDQLVDAYFAFVHPLIPLLNEEAFRQIHNSDAYYRHRQSKSFLGLMYMVYALGCAAITRADYDDEIQYFRIARRYIGLDSLGDGSLESLQGLCLMGGYYLHYRHFPNSALAVTGAALRMACSLGLHIEQTNSMIDPLQAEIRRRTWWTLYCMDIWGLATLGRPGLGINMNDVTTELPSGISNEDPLIDRLLAANVGLCKIMQQVETLLTRKVVPECHEIRSIDDQLTSWYAELPDDVKQVPKTSNCYTSCCVVRWRYQNTRLIVHRNALLDAALGRGSLDNLTDEHRFAVLTCRAIAQATINDVCSAWMPHVMSCWKGVWFLFQASLIMLVSLFSEDRVVEGDRQPWVQGCEQTIDQLERMAPWSFTANSTLRLVTALAETAKQLPTSQALDFSATYNGTQNIWDELANSTMDIEGWLDQVFGNGNQLNEFTQ